MCMSVYHCKTLEGENLCKLVKNKILQVIKRSVGDSECVFAHIQGLYYDEQFISRSKPGTALAHLIHVSTHKS